MPPAEKGVSFPRIQGVAIPTLQLTACKCVCIVATQTNPSFPGETNTTRPIGHYVAGTRESSLINTRSST